jgi:hypothetical protein
LPHQEAHTTESAESQDEEDEDQVDATTSSIPELVLQIANSDSSDTDVASGIRQWAKFAQDEDNCSRIAYCGGNLAVIQTMHRRLKSASVQGECCFALWTFAVDDEQNQQAIRDLGGVQAIVMAMTTSIVMARTTHPDCESLQMKAYGALDTLINDDSPLSNSDTFCHSGGILAVVNAMNTFSDSPRLRPRYW